MLISVDPGLHKCGVAVWSNELAWPQTKCKRVGRSLLACELVRTHADEKAPRAAKWAAMAQAVAEYLDTTIDVRHLLDEAGLLVIELPQVYAQRQTDPNDLIDVAGVAGAIASALHARTFETLWSPLPRDWKGQLPKRVSMRRVKEALSPAELNLFPKLSQSEIHNVYDGVHLGIAYMQKHERLT